MTIPSAASKIYGPCSNSFNCVQYLLNRINFFRPWSKVISYLITLSMVKKILVQPNFFLNYGWTDGLGINIFFFLFQTALKISIGPIILYSISNMFEFSYIMKEFIGEYSCYMMTPMRYGIIDMVYVQSFFLAMYRYMICLHGKKINCLGQHVSTYYIKNKF